jgi:cyclic pyranopterin phosphate synthase
VPFIPHEEILSFEEIHDLTRTAVRMGIDKVRLTGGEPLVRRGILVLVEMLAGIEGIRDYAMSTNGVLLAEFAGGLKRAGLHRVNVSLDAVDPARYRRITRGGRVASVLAGIEAAAAAGLKPIKLNCVVERSAAEPDAQDVAAFAKDRGLEVRFIRRMDPAAGRFWPVEGGHGGDCARCDRLRLTSNGMIRPCLFSDLAFSVRELGPRRAIEMAVEAKPEAGRTGRLTGLYQTGG